MNSGAAKTANVDRPPSTILLVDDDDQMRRILKRVLDHSEWRLLEAASATEAIALLAASPDGVDLVVTDVVLPDFNGCQMIRRMREARPNLRALYISGYDSGVLTRSGESVETANFLAKPFRFDDLVSRVTELLKGPQ